MSNPSANNLEPQAAGTGLATPQPDPPANGNSSLTNAGTANATANTMSYAAATASGSRQEGARANQTDAGKGNALKRKQPTGGKDPQPARPPPQAAQGAVGAGTNSPAGAPNDRNDPTPEIIDDPMHGGNNLEEDGENSNPTGGPPIAPLMNAPHAPPTVYISDDALDNPHWETSHMTPEVTAPPAAGRPHTVAVWPKVVLSSEDLTRNINPTVLHNILEHPYNYLALIPYGSGYRHRQDHPDLAKDVQEFLQSFAPTGCDDMAVVPADPANATWRNNFDQPWTLILVDISPEFRAWLLRESTFAFLSTKGTKYSFTVRSFAINVRSWHITHLVGYGVSDKIPRMGRILERIIEDLSADSNLRALVDECFAGNMSPAPDTIDDKMVVALSTFSLQYSQVKVGKKDVEILTLMGKPITTDKDKHRKWLDAIRRSRTFYIDGVRNLVAENVFNRCDFCKSETHPESSCPFPNVPDWKGPLPQEVRQKWAKEDAKAPEASSSKGKNREDGEWKGKGREDSNWKGKGRDEGDGEWKRDSNKRPRGNYGPRGSRGGNRRRGRGY
ncbi:hypothetical protein EYR38_001942 [Pleurotus pulmonarius]|nr:hypothetical protein EYR38_001942 [Pleurotus pulmonarius]